MPSVSLLWAMARQTMPRASLLRAQAPQMMLQSLKLLQAMLS
jgi:hypothetical protein